jgi:hypothetical protein
MYKQKYLKYKNKYLNLKNEIYGGVNDKTSLDDVLSKIKPGRIIMDIDKTKSQICKDIIREHQFNAKFVDFAKLPSINTDIPNINIIENKMCSKIEDKTMRLECNIYYNKCRIKDLFDKYKNVRYPNDIEDHIHLIDLDEDDSYGSYQLEGIFFRGIKQVIDKMYKLYEEPDTYTIDTLNKILLRTITHNNMTDDYIREIMKDQQTLINFGANVTTIDDYAFKDISKYDGDYYEDYDGIFDIIIIPNIIKTIGESAFYGSVKNSVIIDKSVDTIGYSAFGNNKIKNLTIPSKFEDDLWRIFGRSEMWNIENITYI